MVCQLIDDNQVSFIVGRLHGDVENLKAFDGDLETDKNDYRYKQGYQEFFK
jgi:hypothetical protein